MPNQGVNFMGEHRVLFNMMSLVVAKAMLPAIREVQKHGIYVDIFSNTTANTEHKYINHFKEAADFGESMGFKVLRNVPENQKYDIMYSAYPSFYEDLTSLNQIKYHVRFNYGVGAANKPITYFRHGLTNYFDYFLSLSNLDDLIFSSCMKSCCIGNIKLADYKRTRMMLEGKKTVLYMPTWGGGEAKQSSANFDIFDKLIELKDKYNIIVKLHNSTTIFEEEKERFELFKSLDAGFDDRISMSKILNETDIILSDLSSVAFDAVAGDVPIALFGVGEPVYFGDKLCLHQQLVQDDIIPGTNDVNKLEFIIEKALLPEYAEKRQKLKKEMFPFEGQECLDAFMRFQDDLLKDRVDPWYIAARKVIREDHIQEQNEIREWVANTNDWLENREKVITDQQRTIEDQQRTIERTIQTYENSTSWKLTKPVRTVSKIIKKEPK
jgi:CDP-glycerol glycerophosphotransferase (TagB/SpsB family)